MSSKAEVEAAFVRILRDSKRKPEQLTTDLGSEFTNASFQAMLDQERIFHTPKEALQDLATLDRAIGELRKVLSRRVTDGGEWYEELGAAVKSMNGTEHTALFNRDPDDVAPDKDLDSICGTKTRKCGSTTLIWHRRAPTTCSNRARSEPMWRQLPDGERASRTGPNKSTRCTLRAPRAE